MAFAVTLVLSTGGVLVATAIPAAADPGCAVNSPGVLLSSLPTDGPSGSIAFPVSDPAATYTTNWLSEARGMFLSLQGLSIPDGDPLQPDISGLGSVGGWWGFSNVIQVDSNDQAYASDYCATRDVATATDFNYSTTPFHGLDFSTSTTYLSADLVRHVWTLTNDTGVDAGGFRVETWANPFSDGLSAQLSTAPWGASYNDRTGANSPAVTQLWGGPEVDVVDAPELNVVPLAGNVYEARFLEKNWLRGRATIPDVYFDDISGEIINWGVDAVTPDVDLGSSATVGYELPVIAPGETVSIVEFGHVQYTTFEGSVACPALPGAPQPRDTNNDVVPVLTRATGGAYFTRWYSDLQGRPVGATALTPTLGYLQDHPFDQFSGSLATAADPAELAPECTSRDGTTEYSYAPVPVDDLTVTAQTDYVEADLVRRAWTFTNNSAHPAGDMDVSILTDLGSDAQTVQAALTAYGRVTSDHNTVGPVVTQLWGGPATTVSATAPFAVADLAVDGPAALAASSAWLLGAAIMPESYFSGLDGTVLNWGSDADPSSVTRETNGQPDVVTTRYRIPLVAPGESVAIVEFAHLQYQGTVGDGWIDSHVADAVENEPYADRIEAPENAFPWTYYPDSGTLPWTIDLNQDGTVTGTGIPGSAGHYEFGVRAEDGEGGIAYATIRLTVGPISWSDPDLGDGQVGSAYADEVTGPGQGTTYFVTAGALPDGLSLHPTTGAVTGTPTVAGTFPLTIAAVDDAGWIDSSEHLIVIAPAPALPVWTDIDEGPFYLGVQADDAIAASGNVTGYTVQFGAEPAGIAIDNYGFVGGTPTALGAYDFTIRATNAHGYADHRFQGEVLGPDVHLELGFAVGTNIADATVTAEAAGLEVGSTWTVTLNSTPIVIGTGVVGPSSILNALIGLPPTTPAGQHHIVFAGVAPGGAPIATTVWFTLGNNGVILAVSLVGPTPTLAQLALTGGSPWDPARLAVVLLGVGAVLLARRRGRLVLAG